MFPDTTAGRLRWALREALVVAGILLFWVGVALALSLFTGVVRLLMETVELRALLRLYEFLQEGGLLWMAITPLTGVTVSIYGLARVGTVVVDHYRDREY